MTDAVPIAPSRIIPADLAPTFVELIELVHVFPRPTNIHGLEQVSETALLVSGGLAYHVWSDGFIVHQPRFELVLRIDRCGFENRYVMGEGCEEPMGLSRDRSDRRRALKRSPELLACCLNAKLPNDRLNSRAEVDIEVPGSPKIAPDPPPAVSEVRRVPGHRPNDQLRRQNVGGVQLPPCERPSAVSGRDRGHCGTILIQMESEPERSVTRVVVRTPIVQKGHQPRGVDSSDPRCRTARCGAYCQPGAVSPSIPPSLRNTRFWRSLGLPARYDAERTSLRPSAPNRSRESGRSEILSPWTS